MARTKKGGKQSGSAGKSGSAKKRAETGPSPADRPEEEPRSENTAVSPADEAGSPESGAAEAGGGELNIVELLSFRLADEEYAADLLKVKEIIRLADITYVPRAPQFVEGIISLRGTVIPIFDLRARIGLKKLPPTRKSRIIIVKLEKGLIGFIADEVTDVMKVAAAEVEPAPGAKEETEHLIGVIHVKNKMVIYMDMDQTMGMREVQTTM